MQDELALDTEDKIKAFTHPYRMKLLHVLKELGRPSTATEVARALGDGPGKTHYHMRLLEAAGIVVVDHTDTVNGIVARYYEPAARHFAVKGGMDGDEGDALRDELSRMISRRFKEGLKGFLERTMTQSKAGPTGCDDDECREGFLYDMTLHCDEDAWQEVRRTIEDIAARYAKEAPGTKARRIFAAGATDLPAMAQDSSGVWPALPRRDQSAYWTFGVSLSGAPRRWTPSEPPLR